MFKHNPYIMTLYNNLELQQEMVKIGADIPGIEIMKKKGELLHIKISDIELRAANVIKQEMLSKGGDACVHKLVSKLQAERSEVILLGTRRQLQNVIKNFRIQPFGLKKLAEELHTVIASFDDANSKKQEQIPAWAIQYNLPLRQRTLIMGVINFTPDSFSDGGKYNTLDQTISRVKQMIADGVDILDIGGESTRPGAQPIDVMTEKARVIPVIETIKKELVAQDLSIPISIDTYKAEVAEAAILAGANIINDVWGAKKDPNMADVAAKYQVPIILMHNRCDMNYTDLVTDIIKDIRDSIDLVKQKGVHTENIIIDPGIGFAKNYQHNLEVMYRLRDICNLGYPVLLGTSNKSLIANTLNLPPDERKEGTAATIALGIERGVDIVRVHDVKEMKRVSMMMDAMVRRG